MYSCIIIAEEFRNFKVYDAWKSNENFSQYA